MEGSRAGRRGPRRRARLYVPGSAQRCTVGPLPPGLNWGGGVPFTTIGFFLQEVTLIADNMYFKAVVR
jgi:hypothetical protein